MAFSGFKNLGSLARIGNVLSSSVGETLGLTSALGLPIAIDFGTGSLKILQVAQSDTPSLVAAACLETPRELLNDHKKRLDFQLEGLPRLIRRGGFKGRRAVCAIPAWKTLCKHASLTRVDGMSLAAQVKDAIGPMLGRDASTLVHRFNEITAPEKGANRAEVVVTAIPLDLVEKLMKGIAACKLDPVGMHSEFAAVLKAFDHVHRRDTDKDLNTLYLDIGASTTGVTISHGKELAFARVIDMGGCHLDELLSRQLRCEPEEAHQRRLASESLFLPSKQVAEVAVPVAVGAVDHASMSPQERAERGKHPAAPGFTPEIGAMQQAPVGPLHADLSEPLDALRDEVLMCLRYHQSQFPNKRVERAIFVGGEARHRGLCQAIAKSLRLPAQMADPLARIARTGSEPAFGVDLKQSQPGWSVALGLCLLPTDL